MDSGRHPRERFGPEDAAARADAARCPDSQAQMRAAQPNNNEALEGAALGRHPTTRLLLLCFRLFPFPVVFFALLHSPLLKFFLFAIVHDPLIEMQQTLPGTLTSSEMGPQGPKRARSRRLPR